MGQPERHPGKFVSGTINWVILDRENDFSRVILSLDLGNKSYQEILQPDYGLDEPLHNFSLGVCLTRNYKVVVVSFYQLYMSIYFCIYEVRVHTLGTNCWRRIRDFPYRMSEIEGYPGKFVSGTINWVIFSQDSSRVILSLDLCNESYQEISQPDYGLDERLCYLNVGVSNECLCVLAHTKTFLDIWLMKDYGNKESWTKLFTVPFAKFRNYFNFANLLYIYEEEDQVLLEIHHKSYVYNYKNGTLKILEIQGRPSTFFNSYVYVESLISP